MAVGHIQFNRSSRRGLLILEALTHLDLGLRGLQDQLATLDLMIESSNGGSSNVDNYTFMKDELGSPDNAEAKKAFDEINALLGKLTTDAEVTFVNAALLQAFHKFG